MFKTNQLVMVYALISVPQQQKNKFYMEKCRSKGQFKVCSWHWAPVKIINFTKRFHTRLTSEKLFHINAGKERMTREVLSNGNYLLLGLHIVRTCRVERRLQKNP